MAARALRTPPLPFPRPPAARPLLPSTCCTSRVSSATFPRLEASGRSELSPEEVREPRPGEKREEGESHFARKPNTGFPAVEIILPPA